MILFSAGRGLDKQQTPLLQFMKDKKDEKVKKREDVRESRNIANSLDN